MQYGNYLWNKFSNFKTNEICRKCWNRSIFISHNVYLKSQVIFNRPNNLEDLRLRIRAEMEQVSADIIERSVHLLSKLSRTHSKSSNNDFAEFKQCERVILRLG
jgi:hypothetical protein